VKVLLDTCTFLWLDSDPSHIAPQAQALLKRPDALAYFSMASVWEIAIKRCLGKLPNTRPLHERIGALTGSGKLTLLSINLEHVLRVESMTLHHRDPFDRLLVAQALCEDLPLISSDVTLDLYGVRRIW